MILDRSFLVQGNFYCAKSKMSGKRYIFEFKTIDTFDTIQSDHYYRYNIPRLKKGGIMRVKDISEIREATATEIAKLKALAFDSNISLENSKAERQVVPFVDEVIEFNKMIGRETPINKPTICSEKDFKFLIDFIREETNELEEAYRTKDIVGVLDAILDIAYVAIGNGALLFGLRDKIVAGYAEVQRSNMSKACKDYDWEVVHTVNSCPEPCDVEKRGDLFLVKRKSDSKLIKSVKYSPADLKSLFTSEEIIQTTLSGGLQQETFKEVLIGEKEVLMHNPLIEGDRPILGIFVTATNTLFRVGDSVLINIGLKSESRLVEGIIQSFEKDKRANIRLRYENGEYGFGIFPLGKGVKRSDIAWSFTEPLEKYVNATQSTRPEEFKSNVKRIATVHPDLNNNRFSLDILAFISKMQEEQDPMSQEAFRKAITNDMVKESIQLKELSELMLGDLWSPQTLEHYSVHDRIKSFLSIQSKELFKTVFITEKVDDYEVKFFGRTIEGEITDKILKEFANRINNMVKKGFVGKGVAGEVIVMSLLPKQGILRYLLYFTPFSRYSNEYLKAMNL